MSGDGKAFGSCCVELKEAMSGEDFEPLITVGAETADKPSGEK